MRWISVWTLILAAFAFWVVPDKNIWFILGCVVVVLISLLVMRYFPPDDDKEYKSFPWPESWKRIGNKVGNVLGWLSIILFSGLLLFAFYMDWFN